MPVTKALFRDMYDRKPGKLNLSPVDFNLFQDVYVVKSGT